jgi:hypothetical protein
MTGDAVGPEASNRPGMIRGQPKTGRSITTVVVDRAGETLLMIRQEVALLRAELREKFSRSGGGTAALGAGALIAVSGWLVLLAAGVIGLAAVMPAWLAALIVGLVLSAIGAALLYIGQRRSDVHSLLSRRSLRDGEEARIRERFR